MESFKSIGVSSKDDGFGELSEGSLLESINFDDLFVGINMESDVLPDLEMEADVFAQFFDNPKAGADQSSIHNKLASNKNEESVVVNPPAKNAGKGRKPSSQSKSNNPQAKIRKVKVDWTPELHRRFVQAVEQLGVDKAVPSRILEIMGIDCLTRHNIASHLQKYRSHRKHLLAREAEAANWNQRRQIYGGGIAGKRDMGSPWVAPTMGFPPITSLHHFRPLHVWGHPSMDQSFIRTPTHSLSPPWVQPVPLPFWHPQHQLAQNMLTPGSPCFPQPLTTRMQKYGSGGVAGSIPATSPHPHVMYKAADPPINGLSSPNPNPIIDFHPSKESIDAAIGDVLSKPWQPLPLGLKAPALDSVLIELQRQGISNIPPSCA
ncbi:transcription activator GLK1-like isoform X3 [Arachis stenosperma]|nr:transcription activator GLK1-like isoform X3 [Arachis stenosperma]XP_057752750.1 transcription activator GLK1-like isoform X3 [Arachis stenosperma]